MWRMLEGVALALVAAGMAMLLAALAPARRLMAELPEGSVRGRWRLLVGLIVLFLAGYAGYLLVFRERYQDAADLVVPAVFFLGACFVLLVAQLSLATARDVRRISVLEDENITDVLTGLRNRRYFDRRLAEEVARSGRHGLPVSLLLVDLDHFKRINDTQGHAAGDRVLAETGGILRQALRETDIAARYGGEEFAVLAPQTGLAGALLLAERLRAGIAAGADGLIIEVHPKPEEALSDGPQSLKPERFAALMTRIRKVAAAMDREV